MRRLNSTRNKHCLPLNAREEDRVSPSQLRMLPCRGVDAFVDSFVSVWYMGVPYGMPLNRSVASHGSEHDRTSWNCYCGAALLLVVGELYWAPRLHFLLPNRVRSCESILLSSPVVRSFPSATFPPGVYPCFYPHNCPRSHCTFRELQRES